MKKHICIVLTVIIVISCFAACSTAKKREKISIDEFIEKYKRADIETLKADPLPFFEDFYAVEKTAKSNEEYGAKFLDWPADETFKEFEDKDYQYKDKEVVLFNTPAEIDVTIHKGAVSSLFVHIGTGNAETDFETAKAITDALIQNLGDAQKIEIDYEEVSEAALRQMFNGEMKSFSVYFKSPESEYMDLDEEQKQEYYENQYYSYTIAFAVYGYGTQHSYISIY
jgi:hypothetical protein